MKFPSKIQLASIAAASLLVATIGVASSLQTKDTAQELDFPAILKADAAGVDYFLKIEGINGESKAKGHEGQIDIMSFSWGVSNTGSSHTGGGGGGAGKVQLQDFQFVTPVSKASPKLFEASATGKHFEEAVLVAKRAGDKQVEYIKITMTDVLVSSYQSSGSAGGDVPTESVSLNYAAIKFEYTPQKEGKTQDGTIVGSYDVRKNAGE